MDGIKLLTAARIIAKAGEQIEALMEVLEEKMISALNDEKQKIRTQYFDDEEEHSAGCWMIKSYLKDIAMFKGNKKKPYAHLAIQFVLYNEDEVQIYGWEPSIYVMYGLGEDSFDLDEESFWLCNMIEEGSKIDGERLWRWEDGWGFVIPLVKLNCEEDLVHQIVEPVKKLIDENNPATAFPKDSVAFKFVHEGDELCILAENP